MIFSAEKKDHLIFQLRSHLKEADRTTENDDKSSFSMEGDSKTENADDASLINQIRRRKMDGLLKLVLEKNQQIESLKNEINESKNKSQTNTNSFPDLNTNLNTLQSWSGELKTYDSQQSIKNFVDFLDKESQIYQKINMNNNTE